MVVELARRNDVLPSRTDWQIMREMAEALHQSGLLPAWIKHPMAALAVIEKGAELGLRPMYALSRISMIEGKPCCDAEGMAAMIYRDHGPNALKFVETTPTLCTVEYCRAGGTPGRLTFSIEDAIRAGLAKKQNWTSYPQAMLRARAISAAARMAFPDTIGGLYTPEELGAEVAVDEHGEMTVVDIAPPVPPPPPFTGIAITPEERAQAEAEYARLAGVAEQHGHRDTAKILAKRAELDRITDGQLKNAIDVLARWERSLQPKPPADITNADDPAF